ncbi:MAG: InlB B-repeat-containing protein, partial [Clostridia bacterium]|nr:InlB B-repeat-containing protein [Clostridia bacterium]
GVKKNTYTVNFTDEKGESIKQYTDVEYGTEVVFDGTEPTKASEKLDEYEEDGNTVIITKEYKFIGWSADTSYVTSNMTVTPIFEVSEVKTTKPADGGDDIVIVTPKTANILFVSGGVIVHKETVTKGESFTGWDGTPVKTSSNPYETYTFIGWDTDRDGVVDYAAGESNAIADVQNDITFTAVFESNLPSKTVNYYNFDGTELLYSASIKCGEKAEYGLSAIPSRTDNTNTYDFAGWAFTTDADETEVVEKLIVGENNIDLYAAYKKTPIVYSYKYVDYDYDKVTGEPEPFQEGSFYYGDRYKYLGSTPTRASTVSTDYAFDGWDVAQSGYDTIYTATYAESVREYTSNLPTADGTYTITDNATIPYGDTFSFTVTVADGYEETEPNVTTASDETLTPVSTDGNSYTYEIKLDGATAEEVNGDLTVTVKTTINNYDVSIGGDAGCEVVPTEINSTHGGSGSFIVTLKEGYTQNAPTITSDGKVTVKLESNEGNKYVYSVTGIKSDAEIKVATKINEYKVVMVNWNGEEVFSGMVEHGKAPVYTNPSKETDKFGGYTFKGWDVGGDKIVEKIENVTAPVTATAVYECNHVHAEDPTADGTAWLLDYTEKATCTETGTRHYKCSYPGCTETKDWVIKARNHNMTEWHIDKAPTCTETGLRSCYCQNTKATEDY